MSEERTPTAPSTTTTAAEDMVISTSPPSSQSEQEQQNKDPIPREPWQNIAPIEVTNNSNQRPTGTSSSCNPALSLAETHPDANTPGFRLEVPDMSAKKFIFRSKSFSKLGEYDVVTVVVPENMQSSYGYGLHVWPSAPILAWYLFEHRQFLVGRKVLELGAGTALPGVLAALCGSDVTLSDSIKLPNCLEQCRITAEMNGVVDKVHIMGLTWGLFLNSVTRLRGNVDLLIGSDCFFDPLVFEDLIATVAYILENNQNCRFLSTYQERSSDWSIQHLLKKWGLKCKHVPLKELANRCRVDLTAMMQNHTIHLLEITLDSQSDSCRR